MHKGSGHPRAAPLFCGSAVPSVDVQAATGSPAAGPAMHRSTAMQCHGSGEPAPETIETVDAERWHDHWTVITDDRCNARSRRGSDDAAVQD